jgi:hypothetical protein
MPNFSISKSAMYAKGPQGDKGPSGPTGPSGSSQTGTSSGSSQTGTSSRIQSRSNINMPVTNFTNSKQSVNFSSTLTTMIKQSDINAQLDNFTDKKQVYTFGPSIPPRCVAVGEGTNTIAYSADDGITWTGLGTNIFSDYARGVAWNGTRWVAVGKGTNSIAYSSDGITWTGSTDLTGVAGSSTNIFSGDGRGVAWNGSIWVAVGEGTNTIAYSSDGISWNPIVGSTSIFSNYGKGIAWNGTMWVAVGSGDDNSIAYSSDGITWYGATDSSGAQGSSKNIFFVGLSVEWNGIRWVAVGGGGNTIAYSSDGITWTPSTTIFDGEGVGVAWNGIRWVAVGSNGPSSILNTIAYSSDGITWTPVISSADIFSFTGYGVAWNGSIWVAVGAGTNSIAYSSDGITWTGLGTNIFSLRGNGVAFNTLRQHTITFPSNLLVAVGQGTNTIAYSNDGITWTGLGSSIFSQVGSCVAWNGKIWVAFGIGTNSIAYSSDGINWTGLGTSIFSNNGNGVAWNGSIWVAVGYGINSIAYSSDGITWTGVITSIFSNYGNGVAWNGRIWVAVGNGTNNTIAYSSDGITWTPAQSSLSIFSNYGNSVAWNGIRWVAVGQGINNTIAYSSDGINWTPVESSLSIFSTGFGVAWNGSMWVAVGEGTHTIAYSRDGINWTPSLSIFSNSGRGIVWNGIRWVAVGQGINNTIAYSSDGINWTGATDSSQLAGSSTDIFSNSGVCVASNINRNSVYIQQPTIAVGAGTNSIAYSSDGIVWTGLGTSIFDVGIGVSWNGIRWVSVGAGTTNTIAYSSDGINWTPVAASTSIFSIQGRDVAWNGKMWVAVGQGANTIAYSSDGITWTGLGTSIFSISGNGIEWNGSIWVAVGQGTTNTIAYSSNGINWTGATDDSGNSSLSIFTDAGRGVAWNGSIWVAVGDTIAYSSDGISWIPLTNSVFSDTGYGVAWNGKLWVAVGEGTTNTIAYSSDGINWTGATDLSEAAESSLNIFSNAGFGVAWNGLMWIAIGDGGLNTIAYSSDGIKWTGLGKNIITEYGYGVAGNPNIGATIVDSVITLNSNSLPNTNKLDIVASNYYNTGYSNLSIEIETPMPITHEQALDAMVTGHAFKLAVNFVAGVDDTRVLGLMQYTRMGRLFTRISKNDHYGTSGQWIQAPDGISTSKGNWPWGSIEGGFFVSEKLGGVRYHVAASSHRYNDRSDTLGGFGFFESGLPFKYLARVVLSEKLLLPPYGVCFPMADEGKLFGAGWIAMPLFEFATASGNNNPLTWTFFADAENFSGPVCCYPPQFFARRISSWAAVRYAEDPSLPPEYGSTNVGAGLAFSGPTVGNIELSVGGEIPNIECAFTTDNPDGSMVWKVPEIRIPAVGSSFLADASFFTERNYAEVKAQLLARSAVTLVPKSAVLPNKAEFEIGVKRVVQVGVTEIDDVLRIDARVLRSGDGNSLVVSGSDASKTLGRYYAQTDVIKDQITNGTGKLVNRRVCDPTTASGPILACDYSSGSKPVAFNNPALEAYVAARALNGIETVILEDGTTVRYGLMLFIQQPAIVSLAVDFPNDFTTARLQELQARFEALSSTNFAGQTRRSSYTNSLVHVDPAMLITPVAGYVPIAVGSEPAGGGVSMPMYTETW